MLKLKSTITVIKLTKNNIFINLTKNNGETITKYSAGTEKYEGAKKKSAIAKFDIATNVGQKLKTNGYKNLRLKFTGRYRHRRSVIKGFRNAGISFIGEVMDTRLKAHNGCRKKKQRRKKKRG